MIFVAVTVTHTFQAATKEADLAEQKTMWAFHSAHMEWNGPFQFGLTGIFGTIFDDDLLSLVLLDKNVLSHFT